MNDSDTKRIVWFFLGLGSLYLLLGSVIYYPALKGGWYFDDAPNIVNNYHLNSLYDSLLALFSPRGVSYLSFSFDIFLWGKTPYFFRLTNVFIHVLNAVLVACLCWKIIGKHRHYVAILAGLLFLLHPVQTSTVNYIVQRMTLLSAFFVLFSMLLLLLYFDSRNEGKRGTHYLFFAIIAGIFSVLSKENVALLPFVVLIVGWAYGRGAFSSGTFQAAAFFFLVPCLGLLAQLNTYDSTLNVVNAVSLFEDTGGVLYSKLSDDSWLWLRYLFAQAESFWGYLRLIFFPTAQALDYQAPVPPLKLSGEIFLGFGAVLILAVASFLLRHRNHLLFFGMGWFVFFIIIESSIFPLDPFFEHRLYLPIVGIIIVVLSLMHQYSPKVLISCSLVVVLLCGFYSVQRSILWGNPIEFWSNHISVVPKASRPYYHLANELFYAERFSEAADVYRFLIEAGEKEVEPLYAEALFLSGEMNRSLDLMQIRALKYLGENDYELFLAVSLMDVNSQTIVRDLFASAKKNNTRDMRPDYYLGKFYEQQGSWLSAALHYQKSKNEVEKKRDYTRHDVAYHRWIVDSRDRLLQKMTGILVREKEEALALPIDVNRMGAYSNLLLSIGMFDEAILVYGKIKEVASNYWVVHYNLGIAYSKIGEYPAAEKSYNKALEFAPGNEKVLLNLASLHLARGKWNYAKDIYRKLIVDGRGGSVALFGYAEANVQGGDFVTARSFYARLLNAPGYSLQAKNALKSLEGMID